MKQTQTAGHLLALLTIGIWGTTFIATKLLLEVLEPVEILFIRFLMGYFALLLACPRKLPWGGWRRELALIAAGLSGVTFYYLLENIALCYTMASNVGVMVSVSPFFTALLSWLILRETRPGGRFFPGFAVAMVGICLISFQGRELSLGPRGDLLALLAALVWAVYSVLTKRISAWGHPTVLSTRRVFAYGLLGMLPALAGFGFHPDLMLIHDLACVGNLLFLGLGASALCFVTWGSAVRVLGAVKTSVYIYMVPVITLLCSRLVLGERLTGWALLGAVLTLGGLGLSQGAGVKSRVEKNDFLNSH